MLANFIIVAKLLGQVSEAAELLSISTLCGHFFVLPEDKCNGTRGRIKTNICLLVDADC